MPSQVDTKIWSDVMPHWGVPSDGRLALTFDTQTMLETYHSAKNRLTKVLEKQKVKMYFEFKGTGLGHPWRRLL